MALWLVALEDDHGMWADEPVGADTEKEAVALALKKWPKIEAGEVRAIYSCAYVGTVNVPTEPAILYPQAWR